MEAENPIVAEAIAFIQKDIWCAAIGALLGRN